jgi:uncharacterized protein Usg
MENLEPAPRDIELLLADYRLTTAEILYRLPDFPTLLQTYIWQEYDIAPKYPVLNRFLKFWEIKIEGRLHSVRVASTRLIRPSEWRYAACRLSLN